MQRFFAYIELKAGDLVDYLYFKDQPVRQTQPPSWSPPRAYRWHEDMIWYISYYAGNMAYYLQERKAKKDLTR